MIARRLSSVALAALLVVGFAPPPAHAAVAPVAATIVDTTDEDVPIELTLEASDVDGGAIVTFQVVGGSEVNGTVGTPSAPNCAALPTCTATVTFTPAADVSGTGGFSFTATDDQGDTSLPATATITINPVNDEPSFTAVADQVVNEDALAQSITGWTTPSAGPADEAGQSFTFVIDTNTNPTLFSSGPAVSGVGTLAYPPAANGNATADITLHL